MNTFSLGDKVLIMPGDREGIIVGKCEYLHTPCQWLLRYQGRDGYPVESWELTVYLRPAP